MANASLRTSAEKAGFGYLEVPLRPGVSPKQWLCPWTGQAMSVEKATLSYFGKQGWRGFAGEGGLLLNLIKAMSFRELPLGSRTTFVEAIYAQNVSFKADRFAREQLLNQVAIATVDQVARNFDFMISRGPFVTVDGCVTFTSTTSILDFFPGLERWMLIELLQVAGNDLIHRIASKFQADPYEFRRGWPDITMWRNGVLRFVEIKAPGDRITKSQLLIAKEFGSQLGLNFNLAAVQRV